MAYSYIQYAPSAPTVLFSVPFPYVDASHVSVKKNGTLLALTTDYFWLSSTQIQLVVSVTTGDIIELRRATSQAARLADFTNSAKLTADLLDTDSIQDFYMAQESFDIAADAMTINSTNSYDAKSKRIVNVANSVGPQDAATRSDLLGMLTIGTGNSVMAELISAVYAKGSALVAFLQAGANAVARLVRDKLSDHVSVRDFGAVGDGVTDDSVAIQRAQDYVESLVGNSWGGCALHFPAPKAVDQYYKVGTAIKVQKPCRWYGDTQLGSVIQTVGNATTAVVVKNLSNQVIQHFVMQDMNIHGTGGANTVPGIQMCEVTRSQVDRVTVMGFDTGVQVTPNALGPYASSFVNTFDHCRIDANNTYGIDLQNSSHMAVISNCQIGATKTGVRAVDCADLRMLNNDIEQCTLIDIDVDQVTNYGAVGFNANILISGNRFEAPSGSAVTGGQCNIRLGATRTLHTVNLISNLFAYPAAVIPVKAVTVNNLNLLGNIGYRWTGLSLIQPTTVTGYSEVGSQTNVETAPTNIANVFSMLSFFPKQSAFLAQAAIQSNVTGDATDYTVTFGGTELSDQGNDFVSPTFTARASALHRFQCSVQISGSLAGHTGAILTLVTTNRSYELARVNAGTARDGVGYLTLSGSTFADMASGNTATVHLTVSGSTKVCGIGTSSFFSGGLAT